MKIAAATLPESGDRKLGLNGKATRPARVSLIGRGRALGGLVLILLFAGLLAGGTYSYLLGSLDEGVRPGFFLPQKPKRAAIAAELVERSTMVRPLDDSQTLKKGDLVVVRPNSFSTPKIQQIAATPNETVVIRRAGAIDSLYMLGGSGYVVVSDKDPTRIVHSEQIAGTLVSGSTN